MPYPTKMSRSERIANKHLLSRLMFMCVLLSSSYGYADPIPPTIADPDFDATVRHPSFDRSNGPIVLIDEGHRNFHTANGRYKPVEKVLRNDGYRVGAHGGRFTEKSLSKADVLIVASAVGDVDPRDPEKWKLPVPYAFTDEEVQRVVHWVRNGGALLLIVDYMPVAGMSANLAAGFGVHIANGYAFEASGNNKILFQKADESLRSHPITQGIESVHTFAGTALLAPFTAEPLLMFGADAYMMMPRELPLPDTLPPADSPKHSIEGWSQGAVLTFGEGRLAVFGEAAMFSAQRYPNGRVMGMNHIDAEQNKQFLINLVGWLSGE